MLVVLWACAATAHDAIAGKDGRQDMVQVCKALQNETEYKECSGLTDSTSVYGNTQPRGDAQGKIGKRSAANNDFLIRMYNSQVRFITKSTRKKSRWFFPVMAVTSASVLSTEEIEISIVPVVLGHGVFSMPLLRYCINIENKTDEVICIDKAKTFRVYNDNTTETYFDPTQVRVTRGGGVKTVFNSYTSFSSYDFVTETYSDQQILTIAPHTTACLSACESWGFDLKKNGNFRRGDVYEYDEDNALYSNKYHITYSTAPDFSTYSTVSFELYAKYIVGEGILPLSELYPIGLKAMIKAVRKVVPDFSDNSHILLGQCRMFVLF